MMTGSSKAFFKSRVASRLVKEYRGGVQQQQPECHGGSAATSGSRNNNRRTVQIWHTPCIVTSFSDDASAAVSVVSSSTTTTTTAAVISSSMPRMKRYLVNPSNPELTGCRRFPYFPRGGPVPAQPVSSTVHRDWQPLGHVSTWGGMEVGTGMLYPVSVVDGLVHQLGGWQLQAELRWLQCLNPQPCPIGTAVMTTAGAASSPLRQHYDAVIHTTPPFYQYYDSSSGDNNNPELPLRSCYESTFDLLQHECQTQPVLAAFPLLGAGARGFPPDRALAVAAAATANWLQQQQQQQQHPPEHANSSTGTPPHHPIVIVFGLLEQELADELCDALNKCGVD
jgi:O-acetyl-ADP-ribose deacetylase (regulator of RNase III)